MRVGGFALSLLSVPLNVQVLRALDEEPLSLFDLRRAVGTPPQTTMRGNLRTLTELGVVERRQQNDFPGSIEYELAAPGQDLLEVAAVLEAWLAQAPQKPLQLGSHAAKNAVKALVEGWSTAIVRALSARSLSLTEISKLIAGVSYPSLERRLTAMRLAGLIEASPGNGRGTPYVVSDWLRLACAPLGAAVRWERTHAQRAVPSLTKLDVEAAFLLSIPLLRLPGHLSGNGRLVVELGRTGGEAHLGGVQVGVEEGRIVSCVSRLEGNVDCWVSGSTACWLRALIEGETDQLEIGGDRDLGSELIDSLHFALFRQPQRT